MIAWVDASGGIAGDMMLGALLDAGADLAAVQRAVDAVLPESARLRVHQVTRAGTRAVKLDVEVLVDDPPHRHWSDIRTTIRDADLPEPVRDSVLAVFTRLAEAEATVHAVPVADIHFHEVGAIDSIADIVGVCAAIHDLGVTTVVGGPAAVGSGRMQIAHGDMAIPGPAVTELLRHWPIRSGGEGELTTPTGAALLVGLATASGELPPMMLRRTGIGAGTRDDPHRANVTRVLLGDPLDDSRRDALDDSRSDSLGGFPGESPSGFPGQPADPAGIRESGAAAAGAVRPVPAVLLETNVDDLDPRIWPEVMAALLRAGASDVWLVPVTMKKGRPGHILSVLADPGRSRELRALMLAHTTTFGVRETAARKFPVDRGWIDVDVDGATVPIKLAHSGGRILRATPEFDQVAALAARRQQPVLTVMDRVNAAAFDAGLAVGANLPVGVREAANTEPPHHMSDPEGDQIP